MPAKKSAKQGLGVASHPSRVHVRRGAKPPRGVLWATSVVSYHARPARPARFAGDVPEPAQPARLAVLREHIRAGRDALGSPLRWGYYRGRSLACPLRCALDSQECAADVLIQEINASAAVR